MTVEVLIAEPNEVARRFLARVVRDSFSDALHVRECGDTAGALSWCRETAARAGPAARRLLLVDVDLPDGGACAVVSAASGAVAVATTLYADEDRLFPALLAGASGYLLKEDRFEAMVERLQKIVRGEPPVSPPLARRLLSHFEHAAAAQRGQAASPALAAEETALLAHLSQGFTLRETAQAMSTRTSTIAALLRSVYAKLHRLGAPSPSREA